MPTVTEEVVNGLAFCPDPRCPGYEQVEFAVKVTEVRWTYFDLGGDLPGYERGARYEAFDLAEGEEPPSCPHCGKRMEATTQERPDYAPVSGQDPLRLLDLDQATIRRGMQATQSDQALELERMRTAMAEMRAEMMAMMLAAREGAMPTVPTNVAEPPAHPQPPAPPRSEPARAGARKGTSKL
jgi:hypothetical protein